jgi:hypothetical protein
LRPHAAGTSLSTPTGNQTRRNHPSTRTNDFFLEHFQKWKWIVYMSTHSRSDGEWEPVDARVASFIDAHSLENTAMAE